LRLTDLVEGESVEVIHGSQIGETEISGLTCDSRKVGPGNLFAALQGEKVDGRDYVAQALEKGAAAILSPPSRGQFFSGISVPVIVDENPRRRYALMAARFFERQPETIVAVTGTNGKTSVVEFCRQIWTKLGLKAASLGTLGMCAPEGVLDGPTLGALNSGVLTTPDPAELHRILQSLADQDVACLALEASSHGLSQYRLDGTRPFIAAFTNFSRDHLDYHQTMTAYLDAKRRLFSEVMDPAGIAIVNADTEHGPVIEKLARAQGQQILSFGRSGKYVRLERLELLPEGQRLTLFVQERPYLVTLPMVGAFQASNALCALAIVLACGGGEEESVAALESLQGVPGRLQKVASPPFGGSIYVDYAHTPDALSNLLDALRPHCEGRLSVVFGCGGDRDPGKRSQMGEIAQRLSDRVFVTDDNPRNEDPKTIRGKILEGCPDALEIPGRAEAISKAVAEMGPGDVLCVAGKGHETGQIIGNKILPFDDTEAVEKALLEVSK
jgi:UDP-N-acetylmuramoyl-L-alanyl-D-glutamate--2,6-diaminopimelate ligase